jgi:hypothetical protein
MHEVSSPPELLSADQRAQADEILGHSEIVDQARRLLEGG